MLSISTGALSRPMLTSVSDLLPQLLLTTLARLLLISLFLGQVFDIIGLGHTFPKVAHSTWSHVSLFMSVGQYSLLLSDLEVIKRCPEGHFLII